MSGKFGALILSFALGVAALVGLSATPSAAYAQAGSSIQSQASTDGGVQDCSNGCYISTCTTSGACTVWYCDSTGCKAVGSYQKIGPSSQSAGVGALAMHAYDDVAFAKTCSGDRCMLYELTPTKATQMGYFENIDGIVRKLRADQ
jgi:hypothetical protein